MYSCILVKVNKDLYRLAEVDALIGDYSKAETEIGWSPVTRIDRLCQNMVESDLDLINRNLK